MSNAKHVPWFKSSFSGGGSSDCVEASKVDGEIHLRDSKAKGDGPILNFTASEMRAFIKGVKAGEFDKLVD